MTKSDARSVNELMSMPTEDLYWYINEMCDIDIPYTAESVEDLTAISNALGQLAPTYAFLINMETFANMQKRKYKKDKALKEQYEDALEREGIFHSFAESTKMLYNAASRRISIKQAINQELQMSKYEI